MGGWVVEGWWCEGEDGRGGVVKSCGAEGRRFGREAVGGEWGGVRLGVAMRSCGEEARRFGGEEVVSDEVGIGGGVESGW